MSVRYQNLETRRPIDCYWLLITDYRDATVTSIRMLHGPAVTRFPRRPASKESRL